MGSQRLTRGADHDPLLRSLQRKRGSSGKIEAFQVQIVAGEHKLVAGINYSETLPEAVKLFSVCIILANAAMLDWKAHQIDIKSAYLNASLDETVHIRRESMQAPKGNV